MLLVPVTLRAVLIAQPGGNGQVLPSSIPRAIEPPGELTDVERRSIELFNRVSQSVVQVAARTRSSGGLSSNELDVVDIGKTAPWESAD